MEDINLQVNDVHPLGKNHLYVIYLFCQIGTLILYKLHIVFFSLLKTVDVYVAR